jgi:hypothetical protein
LPLSAVDAIGPAFQHTKLQLIRPFRLAQWGKLALVGLLAGELGSGGGCNASGFSVPIPRNTGTSQHVFPSLPSVSPELLAVLIAGLIVVGALLAIVFLYLNSMMRFVLFDSILEKRCQIQRSWSRRAGAGLRYFVWQIVFMLCMLAGMVILVGIPAAVGLGLGWFKDPGQHLAPLILGGIVLFFLGFAFVVTALLTQVLTKDFVVPQMALENVSAFEAWRRLLPMLDAEKGGYAGYVGMKIVLALGAAVLLGIVAGVTMLVLLIPIGGFGAVAVLLGHAAGMTWNLYTITLAVVVGAIVLCVILYVTSLISVPVIVFFPAYSIYFFASRYPALAAVLYPMPPPATLPPPPSPAPIG